MVCIKVAKLMSIWLLSLSGIALLSLCCQWTVRGESTGFIVMSESEQQLFQVVRRKGWSVPGLNQAIGVSQLKTVFIDGKSVQKKKLKLSNEPVVDSEFYYVKGDGQLLVNSVSFVVRDLYSYQTSEKVFAYEAQLVPVNIGEEGARTYLGAMVILYYYDNDGNGSFETRYGNLQSPSIPVWAQN